MTSKRLPGKILEDIAGTPEIIHVVRRAEAAEVLNDVIVATSTDKSDDSVESLCKKEGVTCYRGSLDDVLGRYAAAAECVQADIIVRLTADCPLLDPKVIRRAVREFNTEKYDYCSNILERTYPKGLDTEVFSMETLKRMETEAASPYDREHVTTYIRNNPTIFRIKNVSQDRNFSSLRWTVDYPADLVFARAVFAELGNRIFDQEEVLEVLRNHPEIAKINEGLS